MNVLKTIAARFAKALEAIGVEPEQYLDLIRQARRQVWRFSSEFRHASG